MPVVPAEVAFTRNVPGASKLIMTNKHVMKDAKAEKTPPKTKAFGMALPPNIQFIPPDNQVHKRWLECEDVPVDIETMEAVWKDITVLRSVRGFVEWLQEHPEVIILCTTERDEISRNMRHIIIDIDPPFTSLDPLVLTFPLLKTNG